MQAIIAMWTQFLDQFRRLPQRQRLIQSAKFALGYAIATLALGVTISYLRSLSDEELATPLQYKIFFYISMVLSVFFQTIVVEFLSRSNMLQDVEYEYKSFIDRGSNTALTVVALFCIGFMDIMLAHLFLTLVYFGIVLFCDVQIAYGSGSATHPDRAAVLARMCRMLAWKVDGISFIGLLALFVLAATIATVAQFVAVTDPGKALAHILPEVFVSGAIGFHLIATTVLLIQYLCEWDDDLAGRDAKVASN